MSAEDLLPSNDLIFKLPPTFDTVEEERRHRKQRLAAAFRCSAGSASTRAWPVTSRPATPS